MLPFSQTAFKSFFRYEPEDQTVYTGGTVLLKCLPPRGRPPPTVSWLHDGNLVSNSSRTLISSKGNLTISPVTTADQGSYVCRADHPLGRQDSQEAVLTVKGTGCFVYSQHNLCSSLLFSKRV